MKTEQAELRCETRIDEQYRARIKVLELPYSAPPPRGTISSITSDVSTNGVRIAFLTTRLVPLGAFVDIRISTGFFSRSFRHHGVVRWARRDPSSPANVLGVEFTETSPGQMRRWIEYVQSVAQNRGISLRSDPGLSADDQERQHDAQLDNVATADN